MREAVENQKFWDGILRGIEGEAVVIEPAEGRLIRIPLAIIKRANLKFEW
jgi:ribosome maturation factor RimP